MLESAGRLQHIANRNLGIELPLAADQLCQRTPVNELHAEEAPPLTRADIVDLHDVRVAQLRGGVGFARESCHERWVVRPALAHHLQGDRPVERKLACEIDRPHSTAAKFALDPIATDPHPRFGTRTIGYRLRECGAPSRVGVGCLEAGWSRG